MRLILGLLEPQKGCVSLYDSSSSCKAGRSARGNFRYVPQGNSLMSGTIRDNLLLANPAAGEEELRKALETAEAGFVFELPEGLETLCGETGSGLSEGQCQRIAIARALLHGGGILLLDESTSSLDPATEARLIGNLRNLTSVDSSLTVIFVSHREAVMASAESLLSL